MHLIEAMHAAQAHVDAMAALLSSGHATAHLHARPHDKNKKRMRIKGGPVAEIHKEAGRALVHDMATTLLAKGSRGRGVLKKRGRTGRGMVRGPVWGGRQAAGKAVG